jgi:hypothetical protein
MARLTDTALMSRLYVVPFSHHDKITYHPAQEIMTATVTEERILAERNSEQGMWAVFQGRNRIRFLIAAWPKIAQQFVGLSVFITYATYFCKKVPVETIALFILTKVQFNMPAAKILSWSLSSCPVFSFYP